MADLIDRQAAKELICATEVAFNTRVKSPIKAKFAEEIARLLDTLPAVDAVEVVHGYWTTTDTILGICCICSACGSCPTMEYKYCPYCGAKMDGERRESDG